MKLSGWISTISQGIRSLYPKRAILMWVFIGFVLLTACTPNLISKTIGIENILEGFGPAQGILRVVAILGGLILAMVGWKIYRFVVALPGFFIGAALGAQIGHHIDQGGFFSIIGFILGGIVGTLLTLALHDLAVFVIGSIGGAFIAVSLWGLISNAPSPLFLKVVGGIIGGLILLAMAKLWMMLLSSAIGATMFSWGVHGGVTVALVLMVVGVVVQYGLARSMGEDAFAER